MELSISLSERLPRTVTVLEQGIADGVHLGAQVYVSLNGAAVASGGVGLVRRDVPVSTDVLFPWYSSGKPIAAIAIAQLWESGKLDLDDRVARFIPEFAQNGKEAITVRHLLTHTGGFRGGGIDYDRAWDEVVAAVCASSLERGWVPGHKAGYHAATSWQILGEIIHRLSGRSYGEYVRESIFDPLGVEDAWFGIPTDIQDSYGSARLGTMYEKTDRQPPSPDLPPPSSVILSGTAPGSRLRATALAIGRFYEMLLAKGALSGAWSTPLLTVQTVDTITAPHRVGMLDATFGRKMDWGLGVMINNAHYGDTPTPYGYGPHASPRAFGHGGVQSSIGFADPEFGLAVAWVCNGQPGEARHLLRNDAINAAIYEDLGLQW